MTSGLYHSAKRCPVHGGRLRRGPGRTTGWRCPNPQCTFSEAQSIDPKWRDYLRARGLLKPA